MGTIRDCTRRSGAPSASAPARVLRPSDAIALVRAIVTDHPEPTGELVIGLDGERRLTGMGIRPAPAEHDAVDAEQLVALAHELDADALVLVSLLADERELRAEADVEGFLGLARTCLRERVLLLDHVLLAGTTWCSLWDAVVGEHAGDHDADDDTSGGISEADDA
jgi:hypothetical protein